MNQKKTVLISINVLVEIPEDVLNDSNSNELNKLEVALSSAVESLEVPFQPVWESTRSSVLDPLSMNCGKCSSCSCWVSDREAESPIHQLNIGARVEGKLLCDECLPPEHKLAF